MYFFFILELQLSTSIAIFDVINQVHQNYANETVITLDNVSKTLNLKKQIYHLRDVVIFKGGLCTGLRVTSGHFKLFSYRSNDRWEMYDDLKYHVKPATKKNLNIEVLLYTR